MGQGERWRKKQKILSIATSMTFPRSRRPLAAKPHTGTGGSTHSSNTMEQEVLPHQSHLERRSSGRSIYLLTDASYYHYYEYYSPSRENKKQRTHPSLIFTSRGDGQMHTYLTANRKLSRNKPHDRNDILMQSTSNRRNVQ